MTAHAGLLQYHATAKGIGMAGVAGQFDLVMPVTGLAWQEHGFVVTEQLDTEYHAQDQGDPSPEPPVFSIAGHYLTHQK